MSALGEKELKIKCSNLLKNDFNIAENLCGFDMIYKKKVIIDFMIFPKEHLIENGFDPVWFGLEVKHFGAPGQSGKMSRFLWQCVSYVQSEFNIDNRVIRPKCVLGFSDVEESNHFNAESFRDYKIMWLSMVRLVAFAHVGILKADISPKSTSTHNWSIWFSTSLYFRRRDNDYNRMKYFIEKMNIGNCSN